MKGRMVILGFLTDILFGVWKRLAEKKSASFFNLLHVSSHISSYFDF